MKQKKINNKNLPNFIHHYWQKDRRVTLLILLSILISIGLFTLFGFLGKSNSLNLSNFTAGYLSPEEVVAQQDFSYINTLATEELQALSETLVYPVYLINSLITDEVINHYNNFFTKTMFILSGESVSMESYSAFLEAEYPNLFIPENLEMLISSPSETSLFLSNVRAILKEIQDFGVFSISEDINKTAFIEVRSQVNGNNVSLYTTIEKVQTRSNITKIIENKYSDRVNDGVEKQILVKIIQYFLVENAFYDRSLSEKVMLDAKNGVQPVIETITKGQRLVAQGQIVTPQVLVALESLAAQEESFSWQQMLGETFSILLLYAFSIFLLRSSMTRFSLQRKHILFLFIIVYIYLVIALSLDTFTSLGSRIKVVLLLPTALITMLICILTSRRVAISFTFVLSLALVLFFDADTVSFIFAFSSGILGAVLVEGVEKRARLLQAGFILSVVQLFIYVVTILTLSYTPSNLTLSCFTVFINGLLSGVLVLGILPLVEHMMNAATSFRLIELSDINAPIMKRMLTLAPGTYSHSLNVSNLSEAACRDIGANALLARVGSYYHDIGKIDQAQYFIENQKELNKHDELKPGLSVAVIKSHVRLGVDKARELGLPPEVVDIIAQHHGSSVISYFYNRALNDSKQPERISPEDFSYNGPLPQTRESAVVMLADMVEAATRTLEKPTVARLEKYIGNLVMQRFSEGVLNESNLTFLDIEKVKDSFIHNLAGFFHSRIEYPALKGVKVEK